MAASLFIVLEREIPEFDSYVDGEAVLAYQPQLDKLCEQSDITPLTAFGSLSQGDAADFLPDEALDLEGLELPDEMWFDAAEGLETIAAILANLEQNPNSLNEKRSALKNHTVEDLREELQGFHTVLTRAAAEGVTWHLGIDF